MAKKRQSETSGTGAQKLHRASNGFDRLPPEIATLIFSLLTETKDVLAARSVCRLWDIIVMNPRPVLARIEVGRTFIRLARPIALNCVGPIPLALTEDALFITTDSQGPTHAEAKFFVKTEGFARRVGFSLPAEKLESLFKSIKRTSVGPNDAIRVALFERVGRVSVVHSGTREQWFSSKLEEARLARLPDLDYRLSMPFNTGIIAYMRGPLNYGALLLTVSIASTPECTTQNRERLAAVTLDTGPWDPQIKYNYTDSAVNATPGTENATLRAADGKECVLFPVDSGHIDERAGVYHEPLFAVKVDFESFREACGYLRDFDDVVLHVATGRGNEEPPIVLKRVTDSSEIKWIIRP